MGSIKQISLVGLSGVGKSIVGEMIATNLGWSFIDTDILIEEGHAVAYFGGSKEEIQLKHLANRTKLLREGVIAQEDYDKAVALMESKK